jgi:hypothetical protein
MNVNTTAATGRRMPKLERQKLARESVNGSKGIFVLCAANGAVKRKWP